MDIGTEVILPILVFIGFLGFVALLITMVIRVCRSNKTPVRVIQIFGKIVKAKNEH